MNFNIFALVLTGLLMLTGCSKNESTSTKRAVSELEYFQALVKTQPVEWTTFRLPTSNGTDVVKITLDKIDNTLSLLSELASGDPVMLKLIDNYYKASRTADQLRAELANLKGREIDLIGMTHDAAGIDPELLRHVAITQCSIADLVDGKYQRMWSEEYSGGRLITLSNFWEEVRDELVESEIFNEQRFTNRESIITSKEKDAHLWCGYQLLTRSSRTELFGGDHRILKSIFQRMLAYPYLKRLNDRKVPNIDPKVGQMIKDAITQGRDLYCLAEVARANQNGKEVVVFGLYHTPLMARILGNYGALGRVMVPKPEDVDQKLVKDFLYHQILQ
jgi:hypothetical protein